MGPDRASFESLLGYLAVGSLCLLGAYFLFDSFFSLYSVVDTYGGSPVWGILAALPTLVVSYLLGLLAVWAADALFSRLFRSRRSRDDEEFVRVALLGIEALTQRYVELERAQRFLEGCSIGFVVLAAGILGQGLTAPGSLSLGLVLSVGSLGLALLSPLVAIRLVGERRRLARAVQKHSAAAQDGTSREMGA